MKTFEENKVVGVDPEIKKKEKTPKSWINPIDNFCRICGKRTGQDKCYLMNDARGFKVCNFCAAEGHLVKKQKLGKAEKKKFKVFKREFTSMKKLPHVTLDVEGKPVK